LKEALINIDRKLFFLINGQHSEVSDVIWFAITNRWFWIPVYVLFAWLLFKKFGASFWKLLIVAALLITITDQTANLFKNNIKRFRPCHAPGISELVHVYEGKCGGSFGFFSGHASNSMAIATFIFMLLRPSIKCGGVLLAIYVILVCISRVALGVHYPADVAAGVMNGLLWGSILSLISIRILKLNQKTISR
jgi:undecaprenyl-diphosphatase